MTHNKPAPREWWIDTQSWVVYTSEPFRLYNDEDPEIVHVIEFDAFAKIREAFEAQSIGANLKLLMEERDAALAEVEKLANEIDDDSRVMVLLTKERDELREMLKGFEIRENIAIKERGEALTKCHELKAEVERLRNIETEALQRKIANAKLREERDRLREALEFYAKHYWHEEVVVDHVTGQSGKTWRPPFSIRNDHGEKAREALNQDAKKDES